MEKEKLLNEQIAKQVKEVFQQLKEPIQVMYFGKKQDCDYCDETLRLVEEVVALSDKLSLSVHDIDEEADLAGQFKVDQAPGLVLAGREGDSIIDYGVRYAGIPAGHEFSSLIQDVIMVSRRDSGLNQKTREFLKTLTQPVLLQVFVTPT